MHDTRVSLKVLRASLPLTQKQLAQLAGLNERTITEIERRTRPIRLTTAFSIINAVNKVLEEKGRPTVTIQDILWELDDNSVLTQLAQLQQ